MDIQIHVSANFMDIQIHEYFYYLSHLAYQSSLGLGSNENYHFFIIDQNDLNFSFSVIYINSINTLHEIIK